MIRVRIWCGVLLACGGLLSGTSASVAQVFPGRITDTVRDSQGAVVAGATVKLSLPSTGVERAVTTNENGEFNFPELSLGTYQLTVSKAGFNTTVLRDITTPESQVNTVNPLLKVGDVNTKVDERESAARPITWAKF
jgi:uncharacterized surface anchored protein